MAELTVASVLIAEPDRGGSFFDLGPRLLMNMQDVAATEVVQPGSRLSYRLLLSGAEVELEALREELPLKPDFNWVSVRESSPRIGRRWIGPRVFCSWAVAWRVACRHCGRPFCAPLRATPF